MSFYIDNLKYHCRHLFPIRWEIAYHDGRKDPRVQDLHPKLQEIIYRKKQRKKTINQVSFCKSLTVAKKNAYIQLLQASREAWEKILNESGLEEDKEHQIQQTQQMQQVVEIQEAQNQIFENNGQSNNHNHERIEDMVVEQHEFPRIIHVPTSISMNVEDTHNNVNNDNFISLNTPDVIQNSHSGVFNFENTISMHDDSMEPKYIDYTSVRDATMQTSQEISHEVDDSLPIKRELNKHMSSSSRIQDQINDPNTYITRDEAFESFDSANSRFVMIGETLPRVMHFQDANYQLFDVPSQNQILKKHIQSNDVSDQNNKICNQDQQSLTLNSAEETMKESVIINLSTQEMEKNNSANDGVLIMHLGPKSGSGYATPPLYILGEQHSDQMDGNANQQIIYQITQEQLLQLRGSYFFMILYISERTILMNFRAFQRLYKTLENVPPQATKAAAWVKATFRPQIL